MEKRLSNIFKTTNAGKLTKTIPNTSYSDLQVTPKWKALIQPAYFLRAVEFWLLLTFKLA